MGCQSRGPSRRRLPPEHGPTRTSRTEPSDRINAVRGVSVARDRGPRHEPVPPNCGCTDRSSDIPKAAGGGRMPPTHRRNAPDRASADKTRVITVGFERANGRDPSGRVNSGSFGLQILIPDALGPAPQSGRCRPPVGGLARGREAEETPDASVAFVSAVDRYHPLLVRRRMLHHPRPGRRSFRPPSPLRPRAAAMGSARALPHPPAPALASLPAARRPTLASGVARVWGGCERGRKRREKLSGQ